MTGAPVNGVDLTAIARPSGAFAMVAADQRDSLRTIYLERTGRAADDPTLRAFKVAAAAVLSPFASAMLLDRQYGLEAMSRDSTLSSDCGLILAADQLVQEPGGPVTDTHLDLESGPELANAVGAQALKLLVIWRDDERREQRLEMVARFIAGCRAAGLISVIEAIVRPAETGEGHWDREPVAVAAAREIGALGPDLYKAEVPHLGSASASEIERASAVLTAAVDRPWVVLSAGVAIERFEASVEAACRGGASGFLAGRAIWSDAIEVDPLRTGLERLAVPRLQRLAEVVDRLGRPWPSAAGRPWPSAVGRSAVGRSAVGRSA